MRTIKQLKSNKLNSKGKKHGYWEYYYPNSRQLWYKGNFINGLQDGIWECYHFNGQLRYKGNYINGQLNGLWEWYYSNGKLISKGNYLNGMKIYTNH